MPMNSIPYSLRWFFYVPQSYEQRRVVRRDLRFIRRLESLTLCRYHYFRLSYLETRRVGPACDLPHSYPWLNWTNRSAVVCDARKVDYHHAGTMQVDNWTQFHATLAKNKWSLKVYDQKIRNQIDKRQITTVKKDYKSWRFEGQPFVSVKAILFFFP